MNGADRRRMHIRIESSQTFADLRRAPVRFVLLQAHDQRLDLEGKLVGLPIRPARAIRQSLKATVVVAVNKLVAGLARDAELPAQPRHLLPFQHAGNELQSLVHGFAHLPGHLRSPQKPQLCYPCARNEVSPFSQEGHTTTSP